MPDARVHTKPVAIEIGKIKRAISAWLRVSRLATGPMVAMMRKRGACGCGGRTGGGREGRKGGVGNERTK